MSSKLIYLALILVSFCWGSSFAVAKIGVQELTPINLVIMRFIIASIFMGGVLFFQGNFNLHKTDITHFSFWGFVAVSSYFVIQYTAIQYTPSVNAALIVATSPIFTVFFSRFLGEAEINLKVLLGMIVAFSGVILLITNGEIVAVFTEETLLGDLLLLFNAIIWGLFTAYGKRVMKNYSPFAAMTYVHIFGTIMMLPLIFWQSPLAVVPLYQEIVQISLPTVLAIIYLAIFCSAYSYYVWYLAVEEIGAVKTSVFSYLNPLVAILAGYILLDEVMKMYSFIGGVIVLTGVTIINLSRKK